VRSAGKTLHFNTTASGAVSWAEAKAGELEAEGEKKALEKSGRGEDAGEGEG
jgi:hypothetical protein